LKIFYDPTKRGYASEENAEIINKGDVMSEAIKYYTQTLFTYYTNLIRDHLDSSNSSEFYKHLFKAFSTLRTFTQEHMC